MMPEHEHADLLQRMSVVETFVQEIHSNHLPSIQRELSWIKSKLGSSRPSWSVATLIAALSSLSVGLIVRAVWR